MEDRLLESRWFWNSRTATPAQNSHRTQQQDDKETSAAVAEIIYKANQENEARKKGFSSSNVEAFPQNELTSKNISSTMAPERYSRCRNDHSQYGQPPTASRIMHEEDAKASAGTYEQRPGAPTASDIITQQEKEEWLEISGYHNAKYRESRLKLSRERRELEKRLADLKKAEEEGDGRVTFASARNTGSLSRPPTASIKRSLSPLPQVSSPATPSTPEGKQRAKRALFASDRTNQPPEKHPRVRQDDPRSHVKYEYRRLGPHGQSSANLQRGSEESTGGEGWRSSRERKDYYPPITNSFVPSHRNRYFLIKSWNHDNVTQSQSDGRWATQTHNTLVLREAFSQCVSSRPPSNVILIFSVNKSAAFQGYAIMTSPPVAGPLPTWAQKLHWTCGEPFYVEWKAKGKVGFRECGYIKNPLNKDGVDLSVVVGRDGQEIEPSAGRELINVIETVCRRI